MRTLEDSWLIATEVTIEPEQHDPSDLPALHVRLAVTRNEEFFWQEVDRGPLFNYDSRKSRDFDKVLWESLVHAFRRAGYNQPTQLADAAYAAITTQLAVPTFGSAPANWTSLGQFLTTTGAPGAAAIREAMGAEPSITFMCVLGTLTLLLNVAVPISRGIGHGAERALERGIAHRIDQLLGTPSESRDVNSSEPPSSQ